MLLVHPPASKPCEPPAGIARLTGALAAHGVRHTVLDASLESMLELAARPRDAGDRWTARAVKNLSRHLDALRSPATYDDPARYARAVSDVNRALATATSEGCSVSLASFDHASLSPLRSADLLHAAERPQDTPTFRWFSSRFEQLLQQHAPRVVGLSISYLDQALTAFAMIGWLRRRHPELRIAAGGGLVTTWSSRLDLQARFAGLVDRFVAGPGERAVLEMCGVRIPPGRVISEAPTFDQFPLGEYLSPGLILPVSASSGCWWARCHFCPERAEGTPYRALPLDALRAELDHLVAKYRPALVHFTDNAISPALLRSLARRPPGPPWYGFARITPELTDPDFCRELAASGCALLKLGVESGSDGVLEGMEKGFQVRQAVAALRALEQARVPTYVYLLFGTPHETEDDARRTLELVAANASAITFLNIAVFNMPLQAPEAARLATRPFYDGDLSLYTAFEHTPGWGRREVKRFIDRELKRHPAVAPIVRRDPPAFTSNHAPFFGRRFLSAAPTRPR